MSPARNRSSSSPTTTCWPSTGRPSATPRPRPPGGRPRHLARSAATGWCWRPRPAVRRDAHLAAAPPGNATPPASPSRRLGPAERRRRPAVLNAGASGYCHTHAPGATLRTGARRHRQRRTVGRPGPALAPATCLSTPACPASLPPTGARPHRAGAEVAQRASVGDSNPPIATPSASPNAPSRPTRRLREAPGGRPPPAFAGGARRPLTHFAQAAWRGSRDLSSAHPPAPARRFRPNCKPYGAQHGARRPPPTPPSTPPPRAPPPCPGEAYLRSSGKPQAIARRRGRRPEIVTSPAPCRELQLPSGARLQPRGRCRTTNCSPPPP